MIEIGDFGGREEDEGSGSVNVSYMRPVHKAPPGVTGGRSFVAEGDHRVDADGAAGGDHAACDSGGA